MEDTRKIKFRAWDKKDKEMYYDIQDGISFDDGSNYDFKRFLGKQDMGDYHEWEVMQFTGLKDKNGKEIYEGDVFQYTVHEGYMLPNFKAVVEYKEKIGAFIYKMENNGWKAFNEHDELQEDVLNYVEVIGNIYENGDL